MKRRISYFFDGEVPHFYYGPGHPMKPHRLKLTHHLLLSFGLYRRMDVYRPHLASAAEMSRFHRRVRPMLACLAASAASRPRRPRRSSPCLRQQAHAHSPVWSLLRAVRTILTFCNASCLIIRDRSCHKWPSSMWASARTAQSLTACLSSAKSTRARRSMARSS